MQTASVINSTNIVELIQRTLNYVDPRLVNHGQRVASLVYRMMEIEQSYSGEVMQDIYFLSLLHDIGAYKTEEINEMVSFEGHDIWEHSIYGYLFLSHFSPLSHYAEAVLFHHVAASGLQQVDPAIVRISQLINLADRVDIFWLHKPDIQAVKTYLREHEGAQFCSEAVNLFFQTLEAFDLLKEWKGTKQYVRPQISLSEECCKQYLNMLVFAIDFRSTHTVTHTIMTSRISVGIAQAIGMDEKQVHDVYYGALLHDLGKIGIPVEILEYPGKLSNQAMQIMRTHVCLTESILKDLVQPNIIRIAIRHHEKLDGSGYPQSLRECDLSMEEQVVAIADIASALLGSRSYKKAYSREKTIAVLDELAADGKISSYIAATFKEQFDTIMLEVKKQCQPILTLYSDMHIEYDEKLASFLNQNDYHPA